MLLFLDTEFTDFIDCDLISIALISADGEHEFYGERTDFNYDSCSDFVRSAVWEHLGKFPDAKYKKHQLAERLREWLTALPFDVTIACDSFVDYELLQKLLDGDLPTNITSYYDMRALMEKPTFNKSVCKYHAVPEQPWHHALHDARALRLGWLAWDMQSSRFGMRRHMPISELKAKETDKLPNSRDDALEIETLNWLQKVADTKGWE